MFKGLSQIFFAGHPEGSPYADHKALAASIAVKNQFIARTGLQGAFVTQISFDASRVSGWARKIAAVNRLPIIAGIYAGNPDPARLVKLAIREKAAWRLLDYMQRFAAAWLKSGQAPSAERMIMGYARTYPAPVAGLHFYTLSRFAEAASLLDALQNGDFALKRRAFGGYGLVIHRQSVEPSPSF